MNKKIVIGVAIAIVIGVAVTVGLKVTLGDKAIELPGEEHAESTLHLQENNTSSSNPAKSTESNSSEYGESGP